MENKKKESIKDPLTETLELLDNSEPYENTFPNEVYETMNTAEEQFRNIDFEERIVFIFELMSLGKSRADALKDIERNIDTTIESYRQIITDNNESHLLKTLKSLKTNKKAFLNFLEQLEIACFILTH